MKRLKRYLPFINFIIGKRPELREKFIVIKNSITEELRVSIHVIKNSESVFLFQYNNLKEVFEIPEEIKQLFEITQYDLLSDDDSDVEIIENITLDEACRLDKPDEVVLNHKENVNIGVEGADAVPKDKCPLQNETVTACRSEEPCEIPLKQQDNFNVGATCSGTILNEKCLQKKDEINKNNDKVTVCIPEESCEVVPNQQKNLNTEVQCAGAKPKEKCFPQNEPNKVTLDKQDTLHVGTESVDCTSKEKPISQNEKETVTVCRPKDSCEEVPLMQQEKLNTEVERVSDLLKKKCFPENKMLNKENGLFKEISSDDPKTYENEPVCAEKNHVESVLTEKNSSGIETTVSKDNDNTKKPDSDTSANNSSLSNIRADENLKEMNFVNLKDYFTKLSNTISIGQEEINNFCLAFKNSNIPKINTRDPRLNKLYEKTSEKLIKDNILNKAHQTGVTSEDTPENQTKTNKHISGNKVSPDATKKKNSKKNEKNISLRELLSLECTFKGFDDSSYLQARSRKRRSSICARSAIALQIGNTSNESNIQTENINNTSNEDLSELSTFKKIPPKRRKTVDSIENKNDTSEELSKKGQEKGSLLMKMKSRSFAEEVPKNTNNINFEVANTDINMTEKNTKTCVLCKSNAHNLTNHFIRNHKAESYTSRLTVEEINDLKSPLTLSERSYKLVNNKFRMPCIFCYKYISSTRLYDHLSTHTGEYAYQCSFCKMQKPYRNEIESHQQSAKNCRSSKVVILYRYFKNQLVIHIYGCKICNFVQLNEANVLRHLRVHHQVTESNDNINENVSKYILAVIKNDDDHIQVHNEACGDVMETNEEDFDMIFEDTKENILLLDLVNDLPRENICLQENNLDQQCMSEDTNNDEMDIDSTNDSAKYRIYKNQDYFGLYKCVNLECFFSTDLREEMFNHINDHIPSINQENGFECYYCSNDKHLSSINALTDHISIKHIFSRFQCPMCSYRSYSPGSVVIHHQKIHGDNENVTVYECYGKVIPVINRRPYMINAMMNNVQKLACSHCEMSFYAISYLEQHLLEVHSKESKCNDYPMYACIYCGENFSNINHIREHIALEHPDELVYACERVLLVGFMDILKNLKMTDISLPLSSENIIVKKQENKVDNQILDKSDTNKSENLDLLENIKPTKEEMEKIHIDMIRPLLWKITSKSGVPPDRIFCCSKCSGIFLTYHRLYCHLIKNHSSCIMLCPHCMVKTELDFTQSKECEKHLEQHIMHQWLCFYCGYTYRNESDLRSHAMLVHEEENIEILEEIPLNTVFSFKIYVKKELSTNRLDFLIELKKMLEVHLKAKQTAIPTKWILSANNQFIENFPKYCYTEKSLKVCFFKNCPFKTEDTDELFKHINATHQFTKALHCSKCVTNITSNGGWEEFEEHFKCHFSKLYVCSLCNYYNYDRQCVITHIKTEHSQRDTILITLIRSKNNTHMGITIVLGKNKLNISSFTGCFVENCEESNLIPNKFVTHLSQSHNILLQYFCEICNEYFQCFDASEIHFKSKHMSDQFAVQLELSTHNNIDLVSGNPFNLKINSNESLNLANTLALSKIKEEVIDEEINNLLTQLESNDNKKTPIKCIDINKLLSNESKGFP